MTNRTWIEEVFDMNARTLSDGKYLVNREKLKGDINRNINQEFEELLEEIVERNVFEWHNGKDRFVNYNEDEVKGYNLAVKKFITLIKQHIKEMK